MSFMMRMYNRVHLDKKIQKRRRHVVNNFCKKRRFKNYMRMKDSNVECVKVGIHTNIDTYIRSVDKNQQIKSLSREVTQLGYRNNDLTVLEKVDMLNNILKKYPDVTLRELLIEIVWLSSSKEGIDWKWDRDLKEVEF